MSIRGEQHQPVPSLALAENLVGSLREELQLSVDAALLGFPSKLPFKVISLREPLLRRIVDLAEATICLCREGRGMGAGILARSVLETTAILYVLREMVDKVVENRSIGELDSSVMAMLFGSKNKKTPVVAFNILTVIGKMDKKFTGILDHYGNLSEVAHPNYAGVLGSYAAVGPLRLQLQVGQSEKLGEIIDNVVVPTLCLCLLTSKRMTAGIKDVFEEFSSICHEAIGGSVEWNS